MLKLKQKIIRAKSLVTDAFREPKKRIKVEMTLLLFLCLILLATVGWKEIANNQFTNSIETLSMTYLGETFDKAGAAFLISRALNATLSVIQSFTITPFIGEVSLGEVLDPANDLVERFSLVMLAVTVSIGIQQLLMEIGIAVDLSWVISPGLILLLASLFVANRSSKYTMRLLAYRMLLFVLLIRFAIPVTGFVGSHISAAFLADKRDSAIESIEKSQEKLSEITAQDAITSPNESMEKIKKDSEEIVTQIVKLITLFVLETILFPLLVLWGLMKLFGVVFYPLGLGKKEEIENAKGA
ncbi:hypothetical protein [Candidatus Parabeggiatoa sp. HSG14]|uniref:hypothetical protein n=1 Tax=Candidatus Parabeggiatoa sp. HSG14 TaxID=3055593 RepID=UPI0025A7EC11|nr:hypothetical protein [Thiotrichales bacterium HSG14]